MEYAVHALARLSGISARTLRYYDQIGLLRPARVSAGGYRIYGAREVDRLQQILFYREMGVKLEEIGRILDAPGYDPQAALQAHLTCLLQQRQRLQKLIENVSKTLGTLKGEQTMTDKEKFTGFKQKLVDENEAAYGAEMRGRWGDRTVDAANARLMGMSEADYARAEALRQEYERLLVAAQAAKDPAGADAQRACDLHRQWLCLYWPAGSYSREAHLALGEGYVADPRFTAYYDRLAPGAAVFLRDALRIYCAG